MVCREVYTHHGMQGVHPPWYIPPYTTPGIPPPSTRQCTDVSRLDGYCAQQPGLNPEINMGKMPLCASRGPKGVTVVRLFCAQLLRSSR